MALAFIRVLPIRVYTFFPKRSLGKGVGTRHSQTHHLFSQEYHGFGHPTLYP